MKFKNILDWKYALREIGLIVIGITIAFALNNWKEGRTRKVVEKQFISNLIEDLTLDSIQLEGMLEIVTKTANSKVILMDYFNGKKVNLDSIPYHFDRQLRVGRRFVPNSITMEEIKTRGGLIVIRNYELRRDIIELYSSYEQCSREEIYFETKYMYFQEQVFPYLNNIDNLTLSEIVDLTKHPEIKNIIIWNYATQRQNIIALVYQNCTQLLAKLREYNN